jgi:L-threonylcarbamoyladenylate synthase
MTDPIETATRALARGELVVYPTDTLFGLGARATDARAVGRLFAAKSRPLDLPVSFAVSSTEEIEPWANLTESMRSFIRRELPGPVTVLVPPSSAARRHLAPSLLGRSGTIGIRIPDHPVARALVRLAGPVTCTSANRHGETNPTELTSVRAELGNAVAVFLTGGPRPAGRASRIVDLTKGPTAIVRG